MATTAQPNKPPLTQPVPASPTSPSPPSDIKASIQSTPNAVSSASPQQMSLYAAMTHPIAQYLNPMYLPPAALVSQAQVQWPQHAAYPGWAASINLMYQDYIDRYKSFNLPTQLPLGCLNPADMSSHPHFATYGIPHVMFPMHPGPLSPADEPSSEPTQNSSGTSQTVHNPSSTTTTKPTSTAPTAPPPASEMSCDKTTELTHSDPQYTLSRKASSDAFFGSSPMHNESYIAGLDFADMVIEDDSLSPFACDRMLEVGGGVRTEGGTDMTDVQIDDMQAKLDIAGDGAMYGDGATSCYTGGMFNMHTQPFINDTWAGGSYAGAPNTASGSLMNPGPLEVDQSTSNPANQAFEPLLNLHNHETDSMPPLERSQTLLPPTPTATSQLATAPSAPLPASPKRSPSKSSKVKGNAMKKTKRPAQSQGTHKSGGPCCNPACCATTSPQWRRGPSHAPTLCNACGTRWARNGTFELTSSAKNKKNKVGAVGA